MQYIETGVFEKISRPVIMLKSIRSFWLLEAGRFCSYYTSQRSRFCSHIQSIYSDVQQWKASSNLD